MNNSLPKVILLGSSWFHQNLLDKHDLLQWEWQDLPYDFPLEKLDYLSRIDGIVLNFPLAYPLHSWLEMSERIAALKIALPATPIVIAVPHDALAKQVDLLMQSGGSGVVFPDDSPEELFQKLTKAFPVKPSRLIDRLMQQSIISPGFKSMLQSSTPASTADVFVRFLGVFEVYYKGQALPLPQGQKLRSLLACFLFEGHKKMPKSQLIQRFWPEQEFGNPSNSLAVHISHLRKWAQQQLGVGKSFLQYSNDLYFLETSLSIDSDLAQFNRLLLECKEHERYGRFQEAYSTTADALALYKADFLQDMTQENWTLRIRDDLADKYLIMLEELADYHIEQQHYKQAIDYLNRILHKDECIESAHSRLITCYIQMGKLTSAQRQYDDCERILHQQMNRKPMPTTKALIAQITV